MKYNLQPSEKILNGVRHVPPWNILYSQRMAEQYGDTLLRSYFQQKLSRVLSDSNLNISYKEAKGFFSGYKLHYYVTYKDVIKLEFIDLIGGNPKVRKLDTIRKYIPGDWEQKLDLCYATGLELISQWNQIAHLVEELTGGDSLTPKKRVKTIEKTGNVEENIRFLAMLSNWENICLPLFFAYVTLNRCMEAQNVANILVSTYPENADCHLILGNLFWAALYNSNPPPKDANIALRILIENDSHLLKTLRIEDPKLYRTIYDDKYRQYADAGEDFIKGITLEALDCSWEFAYKKSEQEFIEAMRLSKEQTTREHIKSQLATLKMMYELK